MKTNINMGRWNDVDDALLARIVIEGVRNGSTQIQAFERAGFALNRTSKACGFRWNKTLRPLHVETFKQAVKEHRFATRKIRSMRVPDFAKKEMHPDDAQLIAENSAKPTVAEVTEPVLSSWEKLAEENGITPKQFAERVKVGTPTRPSHYHKGGIDIIGFLESHFGQDKGYTVIESFCIGNIVKYVTRYKQKNGIEDLEKAEYYLNQLKQQGE